MPVTCYAQTLSERQILWPTAATYRQSLVHPLQSKMTGTLWLASVSAGAVREALGLALPFTPSAGRVLQIG